MSSQEEKKNLLPLKTTLLERAARYEQVSVQKNNVLARHTVQMHTLVVTSEFQGRTACIYNSV